MGGYKDNMLHGFRYSRFNRQAFPISLEFVKNKKLFEFKKNFWERIPDKILDLLSRAPLIGNPAMRQQIVQLKQVRAKANNAVEIMDFFINGDWQFDNKRINLALAMMSHAEVDEFQCDVRTIEWHAYLRDYIKGLSIWALYEDQIAPEHGYN